MVAWRIRTARPEDAEDVAEIAAQPRVIWGTLQLPGERPAQWRKRLEGNDPHQSYVLVAEVEGKVVGMASLFWSSRPRNRHVGSLGIMVHDAFQGQGIGKALFGELVDAADRWFGLLRLELGVYADNQRGIKLYESYGFVVEGRKRMDAFRDGQYVDTLMMGRIRPGA